MKTCEGPLCATYNTQDRLRGTGENKHYTVRRSTIFWNRFCSQQCAYDEGVKPRHRERLKEPA